MNLWYYLCMKLSIRLLYLYLFSFVGLIIAVIGSVQIVDLTIKTTFFADVDVHNYSGTTIVDCPNDGPCFDQKAQEVFDEQALENARKNLQRQLSSSLSMIVVGIPLYLYHWSIIKREKGKS